MESVCANGSLNNRQAEANSDGSYTYVIALKDPGVPNWLDTGGLHDGEFLIRWQDLPESFRACAVRRVERLPLTDLQQLIPTGTRHVMPEERKAQLLARTQAYANRLV